ncbi:hypothetical protein SLA2020_384500 [Shorea laevis]
MAALENQTKTKGRHQLRKPSAHNSQADDESSPQSNCKVMKLMEMEKAIRNANCKVDIVKAAVKKLEIQNAEIRTEMEAFKLCTEVAKKERKRLKRIMALEKQHNKLKGEIQDKKKKSL